MTSKNSLPGFNLKFFQILYHCLKIRKALKRKSTATKAQAAQTQLATHGVCNLESVQVMRSNFSICCWATDSITISFASSFSSLLWGSCISHVHISSMGTRYLPLQLVQTLCQSTKVTNSNIICPRSYKIIM